MEEIDTDNEKGRRDVMMSRNPRLVEGFNLNKRHPFDWMVRNPVDWSIAKETFSARIEFPALIPGINFSLPDGHFPVYQLIAVLAVVPDMFHGEVRYKPLPEFDDASVIRGGSDWFPVSA